MASVIEGVRKVLSVPEDRVRTLDRANAFAKRFVIEMGQDGVGTPRHVDSKLPPLALQLCHLVPLAWLETSITLKSSFLFWAGSRANVADGPMAAVFSTNHRVEGWSVLQAKHAFMKHLIGDGCLPGVSQSFQGYGMHPPHLISDVSGAEKSFGCWWTFNRTDMILRFLRARCPRINPTQETGPTCQGEGKRHCCSVGNAR
jgi:hypothetical protein